MLNRIAINMIVLTFNLSAYAKLCFKVNSALNDPKTTDTL